MHAPMMGSSERTLEAHGQALDPGQARIDAATITAFARDVAAHERLDVGDFHALWRWSVDAARSVLARGLGLLRRDRRAAGERVLVDGDQMPGARWFPDARLNFAENLLRRRDDARRDRVLGRGQGRSAQLTLRRAARRRCRALAQALRAPGVGAGDRVAGFMPNMPETIIAMLGDREPRRDLVARARPISACRACSTASARSSPRCCSPSTATATTARRIDCLDKVARDRREAADASSSVVVVPYLAARADASRRCRTRDRWHDFVAPHAARRHRVRAAAVRPSALHPLLVRHDRRAEVHRARRRRHAAAAPEGAPAAHRRAAAATACSTSRPAAG